MAHGEKVSMEGGPIEDASHHDAAVNGFDALNGEVAAEGITFVGPNGETLENPDEGLRVDAAEEPAITETAGAEANETPEPADEAEVANEEVAEVVEAPEEPTQEFDTAAAAAEEDGEAHLHNDVGTDPENPEGIVISSYDGDPDAPLWQEDSDVDEAAALATAALAADAAANAEQPVRGRGHNILRSPWTYIAAAAGVVAVYAATSHWTEISSAVQNMYHGFFGGNAQALNVQPDSLPVGPDTVAGGVPGPVETPPVDPSVFQAEVGTYDGSTDAATKALEGTFIDTAIGLAHSAGLTLSDAPNAAPGTVDTSSTAFREYLHDLGVANGLGNDKSSLLEIFAQAKATLDPGDVITLKLSPAAA